MSEQLATNQMMTPNEEDTAWQKGYRAALTDVKIQMRLIDGKVEPWRAAIYGTGFSQALILLAAQVEKLGQTYGSD